MDGLTLLLLAVGLAMDAFAVSISNTMCFGNMSRKYAVGSSLCFGIFQGVMPTIGFFAGMLFESLISRLDHWVALVLLGIIGGKMLVEGIQAIRKPESCQTGKEYGTKLMFVQGVATSIDALAVGISFSALSVNIFGAALVIGIVTFAFCLLGSAIGRKAGTVLGDWAQVLGGVILLGIGIRIFVEHMINGV